MHISWRRSINWGALLHKYTCAHSAGLRERARGAAHALPWKSPRTGCWLCGHAMLRWSQPALPLPSTQSMVSVSCPELCVWEGGREEQKKKQKKGKKKTMSLQAGGTHRQPYLQVQHCLFHIMYTHVCVFSIMGTQRKCCFFFSE